jgi:hypothetical protein
MVNFQFSIVDWISMNWQSLKMSDRKRLAVDSDLVADRSEYFQNFLLGPADLCGIRKILMQLQNTGRKVRTPFACIVAHCDYDIELCRTQIIDGF